MTTLLSIYDQPCPISMSIHRQEEEHWKITSSILGSDSTESSSSDTKVLTYETWKVKWEYLSGLNKRFSLEFHEGYKKPWRRPKCYKYNNQDEHARIAKYITIIKICI